MSGCGRSTVVAVAAAWLVCASVSAHDGPPFPVVSRLVQGAYEISVWTDPDTTDNQEPGGQFWVILRAPDSGGPLPSGTRVDVAIRPLDRDGARRTARAAPVDDDVARQFAALVMDHEGRFAVEVEVSGPLGRTVVTSAVDATYDLRPPPAMMALYVLPFLIAGVLWLKLIVTRRRAAHRQRGS
jgi:hypothetical protein